MIELEIKKVERIEKETALFCLDDCIATLADYYQCDYEMMYIGGYKMIEQPGIPGFASRYHVLLQGRFDNLKRYHGLEIKKCDFYRKRSIIKIIKRELEEERPVLLLQNPYWCPWDDGFQRYDAVPGHCFIIQGVYEDGFLCVDSYFDKAQLELPYSLFRKGVQEVYLTCQAEKDKGGQSSVDYQGLLGSMFHSMTENGYFTRLHNLVGDMDQSPDIFQEVRSDEDFWISPLVVLLLQLNQSIQNIATVTKYVAKQCKSAWLDELGVRFWNYAVKWKQARKLVIKLYYIKRKDEDLKLRTMDRMWAIADDMERMAHSVMEGREEVPGDRDVIHSVVLPDSDQPYLSLDLKEYMNNKAFLKGGDLKKGALEADFSSVGNCYVLGDKEESEPVTVGDGILLSEVGQPGADNIACNGQRIVIPSRHYSHIVLIGAAEFGNSSDVIRLLSSDGREYEMAFQFTDYIFEPCFGETVVWRGKGIHKREDGYEWMLENLYLYQQELTMPDAKIGEIVLPINPSVHLFAVRLKLH